MEASVRPGAALWITGATFLYFSGCNAHTLSLSVPLLRVPDYPSLSLSLPRLSLSSLVALLSFHGFPLLARRPPFLSFDIVCVRVRVCVCVCADTTPRVFSAVRTRRRFPLLSLSVAGASPDSIPPTVLCPLAEQTETRHSPSPLRIVTLPAEMETAPVSYSPVLAKPSSRIIH